MEILGWFIFDFIIIWCIYYFMFVRRTVRGEKVPVEANYLIAVYKLDVNKFSYRKFIKVVGLVTSFDTSLVATLVMFAKGLVFQILFGVLAVFPVIIISFMLLGNFYKKKQKKDNKKELEKEKKYLDKLEEKDKKKEEKKNKKEMKKQEKRRKHVK